MTSYLIGQVDFLVSRCGAQLNSCLQPRLVSPLILRTYNSPLDLFTLSLYAYTRCSYPLLGNKLIGKIEIAD
jgi:hypothetical protein